MGGGGSSRNRFAFSDGPKSFGGALSNLGEALKVGEAGVALEVDELPSKHETLHFVSNPSQKRRFELNIYKMFLKRLF